jgi:hypothetical protein
MTTGGRPQPGCMMKILEAEQWRKGANPHEVVLLWQQQEEGKIGSAIAQEAKSASSPAATPRGGRRWHGPFHRMPVRSIKQSKVETLKAKGRRELRGERTQQVGEKRRHGCYSRDEPLLKGRLPRSRLETPRKVSPDAHRRTQPMTRGPSPKSHTAGALASECGEGEPPRKERIAAPLHIRQK